MDQKVLGKIDVLKVTKLKKELLPVPEWGGSIWVQEMTGKQRDAFDNWVMTKEPGAGGMRIRMVIATAVDEKGDPLFSDLDIPDLLKKSGKAITRVADKGMELSGMNEESKEVVTKNSEPAPSEDSSSSSAAN